MNRPIIKLSNLSIEERDKLLRLIPATSFIHPIYNYVTIYNGELSLSTNMYMGDSVFTDLDKFLDYADQYRLYKLL